METNRQVYTISVDVNSSESINEGVYSCHNIIHELFNIDENLRKEEEKK